MWKETSFSIDYEQVLFCIFFFIFIFHFQVIISITKFFIDNSLGPLATESPCITGMEDVNKLFNEKVSISKQHETKICFFYLRNLSYVFARTASRVFIAQYLIKQFNFTVLYLQLKLQNLKIQRDVNPYPTNVENRVSS